MVTDTPSASPESSMSESYAPPEPSAPEPTTPSGLSSPSEPSTPPVHSEFYNPSTGRDWPPEAVDRFLVGRIHGPYDLAQTCVHLRRAYESFADITVTELQRFWDTVLPSPGNLFYWSSRLPEDPKLQKVLRDIKVLLEEEKEEAHEE